MGVGTHYPKSHRPIALRARYVFPSHYFPSLTLPSAIVVLQPTSQPATKATGLARHQLLALPAFAFVTLGTLAIVLHKTSHHKAHFRSWHGVCHFSSSFCVGIERLSRQSA